MSLAPRLQTRHAHWGAVAVLLSGIPMSATSRAQDAEITLRFKCDFLVCVRTAAGEQVHLRSTRGVTGTPEATVTFPASSTLVRLTLSDPTDEALDAATEEAVLRCVPDLSVVSAVPASYSARGIRLLLRATRRLESLELGTYTPDECMATIAGLTSLTSLMIRGGDDDDGPNRALTDAGIAALAPLKMLRTLHIRDSRITGTTLGSVTSPIEELSLEGSRRVADDCLAVVGRSFLDLRRLRLTSTRISDRGLGHLASLTRLEELDLADCTITGEGMGALAGNERLRRLSLEHGFIDARGLAQVARLSSLEFLTLEGCRAVSDGGLTDLGRLRRLRELNLAGCNRLSDRGIAALASVGALERLQLPGRYSDVTPEGVERLREQLPQCEVSY